MQKHLELASFTNWIHDAEHEKNVPITYPEQLAYLCL